MPKELTREELFKQIWARPMTKVAAEYGISDVALKKICTKGGVSPMRTSLRNGRHPCFQAAN